MQEAMGMVPMLVEFIAQPDNPAHVYELPQAQR
jgi:hypothetical protein